jgi:hypothetical protein
MKNQNSRKLVEKLEKLSDELLRNANNSWEIGYSWGLQKAANVVSTHLDSLEDKF